ncbi:MAG: ImmA/IrrE family metallo-endopeptidase [Candidatus Magnetomorum sp.]|nr:ImmA/IrrE family metallo-endopeptidase [Candidatus Magnetomorum sp.]
MEHIKPYTPKRFDTASELINHLETKENFTLSLPVDIDTIADLLGIKVRYIYDQDNYNTIGSISLKEDKATVKINIPQNDYEPRRRFTLAHEIGHLCKHLSESRSTIIDTHQSMNRTASYWDTIESEANTFAAQLLMPKEHIFSQGNHLISEYQNDHCVAQMPVDVFVENMSRIFKVSTPAMRYRLKNLGLIDSLS